MTGWVPFIVTSITTIFMGLIAWIQSRRAKAAEARKLEAESDTVVTEEHITAAKALTKFNDELLKERIKLSEELCLANERAHGYEAKLKQQEEKIAALEHRVVALEHLEKTLLALSSYPPKNTV